MVDIQYLLTLSPRLQRFKKKSNNLYNFRCPYCGDSQKKQSKARGFVYSMKNEYFYKCHNCSKGTTLGKLIEHVDPQLYKEYVIEKYKGGKTDTIEYNFKPVRFGDNKLKGLTRFDKLQDDHPALNFIKQRRLEQFLDRIYFCPKFYAWVNSLIPNKFQSSLVNSMDHPRVVLPFFGVDMKMFAFQGRAFGNEEPRYITIKLDDNNRRIFGLEKIDVSKKVYVVEGPIDSLFLPNCIAVAGADMKMSLPNAVYIFDNEPRNKQIVDKIQQLIFLNKKVCIFPKSLKHKDINDMIIAGMTQAEILNIIDSNTFSKLSAQQQLNNYKEV